MWSTHLRQAMLRERAPDERALVALLGIGQCLRGDDAIGPLVARRVAFRNSGKDWLALDCGTTPEAYTGRLRRFRPRIVLLIDAFDMEQAPGAISFFETWDAKSAYPGTHGLPLSALADYLRGELGCCVWLLGVQPACVEFGTPLSGPARRAVNALVRGILALQQTTRAS